MEESKCRKLLLYGLAGIGALFSLKGIVKSLKFAKYYFTKPVPLQTTYGENTWALITGGNKGIGYEFAKQLGNKGFNIMILDKDHKEAQKTTEQLSKILNVKVTSISEDISNIKDLSKSISEYDVSILVNNAGIAYSNRLQ